MLSFKNKVCRRRGVSSIQYCIVLMICVCVATSAAFILSTSFSQLSEIANLTFTEVEDSGSNLPQTVVGIQPEQTAAVASELSALSIFVAISTLLILALSYLYLNQGKRKLVEKERMTCHIDLLAKKNLALETVLGKRQRIHNQLRLDEFSMKSGRVIDIMSTGVHTISANMDLDEAEQLLVDEGFRRTIVVDKNDNLLGVLSRKDISSKQGNLVAHVMTSDPKTATPDMEISVALTILLQNRISCLPVVKGEKFVGLVSTSDMLIYLQCLLSKSKTCSSVDALV